MSVKIRGLKLFNANHYAGISVIENTTGYNVHIKGTDPNVSKEFIYLPSNSQTQLFQSVASVFKYNRKQSDKDRVIGVISSFLQYTTINRIMLGCRNLNDSYDMAVGTRQLKLQVNNPISEIVKQMVFQKYSEDRLQFCAHNNAVKKITIMPAGITSYELYKDEHKEEIRLYLLISMEETAEQERSFLQRFITDKLNECGKPARLECGHLPFIMQINSYVPGFANLICDDVQIDIYSKKELLDIAQQVIEKHNQELKQNKMIQLKMEGF